jgi:histidine triad (HIT) family protein
MYAGYDHSNIFAKILTGDIPCKKVYECECTLCFPDIAPKAKTHLLLIPKGPYVNIDVFARFASAEEIVAIIRAIPKAFACASAGSDFYIKINTGVGPLERQEVMHFHMHLISCDDNSIESAPTGMILSDSEHYTIKRENNSRAWICFKELHDFGDLASTNINIFKPIPDLVHNLGATAGFNLHLLKTKSSLAWRIDWATI